MAESANDSSNVTPFRYGSVAPDFWLDDIDGILVKRHDFRNKAALILLFLPNTAAGWEYAATLRAEQPELTDLNVIGLVIIPEAAEQLVAAEQARPLRVLPDPTRKAWSAYHIPPNGAGAFVLDLYGGLEAQHVANSVAELPPAVKLVEWARGAQYRCNI